MLIANLSDLTFDEARILFEKNSSDLGTSFFYSDKEISMLYNKVMCINLGKNKQYISYADALKRNIVNNEHNISIKKKRLH
jgi:hypothetical protein